MPQMFPKDFLTFEEADKGLRKKRRGRWHVVKTKAGLFRIISHKQKSIFYKNYESLAEIDCELLIDIFSIPANKLSPAQKKKHGVK